MSSNPRLCLTRRAALLGLFGVSACGLTPVYAPGSGSSVLRNNVDVTGPDTIGGYHLRQRLVDRLGRAQSAQFQLAFNLNTDRRAATITTGGDTTRFDLTGAANWTLTDNSNGNIRSGQAQTFTSYSTTGSTVATQTAQADAQERLSIALGDLIVTQMLAAIGEL